MQVEFLYVPLNERCDATLILICLPAEIFGAWKMNFHVEVAFCWTRAASGSVNCFNHVKQIDVKLGRADRDEKMNRWDDNFPY